MHNTTAASSSSLTNNQFFIQTALLAPYFCWYTVTKASRPTARVSSRGATPRVNLFCLQREPLDGDDVKGLAGHAKHARTRLLLGTVQKKYI